MKRSAVGQERTKDTAFQTSRLHVQSRIERHWIPTVMSPRVAELPWRSVDSSGLSMSRRPYSRATDHRPWSEGGGISKRAIS